ncbi:unnamed protein product [Paramecium pentaurelia]|uniref:Uncharacterized protein n=1 Tax=Paramecium pentaurelia TaxID=43138 RepID=A0A8S1TKS0_9CILI|nr:unnamed protein product [Paramecium pentaurelia]
MILILEECDNHILSCIRYSVLAVVSLIIAIISISWSFHYYKANGSIKYEIAPMICCCLQAIVHLIQYTIYNSNRMIISASLLQLITFILVSQSLANLRYRFKYADDLEKRKNRYLRLMIGKGAFYLIVFSFQFFFFFEIDDSSCNNYFYYSLDLLEVQILIITIFTQIHGQSLIYYIRRKEESLSQNQEQYSKFLDSSSMIKNTLSMKLKQIKLVIWAQTITMITFIVLIIIMYNTNKELFCFQKNKEQTYSVFQISIQIFFTVVQQFPCFYIPYAFYYAEKTRSVSKATVIDFNIQYDESTAEQQIQRTRKGSSLEDNFVNMIHSIQQDD